MIRLEKIAYSSTQLTKNGSFGEIIIELRSLHKKNKTKQTKPPNPLPPKNKQTLELLNVLYTHNEWIYM